MEYLVAGLTAFYMFRLYFGIFWNKEPHYHHTPHESPPTMTIPACISCIGISVYRIYSLWKVCLIRFQTIRNRNASEYSHSLGIDSHWSGISLAFALYRKESPVVAKIVTSLGSFYKVVYNKFYIDEVYLFITKRILFNLVSRPVAWFDRHVVDATMNRIGWLISVSSEKIKGVQSGQLQHYALAFVSGVVILALIVLYNLS